MNTVWDVQEDPLKLERLGEFELNWPTNPATHPLYVTKCKFRPDFR